MAARFRTSKEDRGIDRADGTKQKQQGRVAGRANPVDSLLVCILEAQ